MGINKEKEGVKNEKDSSIYNYNIIPTGDLLRNWTCTNGRWKYAGKDNDPSSCNIHLYISNLAI